MSILISSAYGKPSDADPEGRAANTATIKGTLQLSRNPMMVRIENFTSPVLIDSGSAISVLSLRLYRRLCKVFLPSQISLLKSAFNTISTATTSATLALLYNMFAIRSGLEFLCSHFTTSSLDAISSVKTRQSSIMFMVTFYSQNCQVMM